MSTKKVIIAGGRDFTDYGLFENAISDLLTDKQDPYEMPYPNLRVLHGMCPSGADKMADKWASACSIPIDEYPAEWEKEGKAAGPIRNTRMARNGHMLIAFWDGKSRGTKNMIDCAFKHKLETHVYMY